MRLLFPLIAMVLLVGCASAPTKTRTSMAHERRSAGLFDIRAGPKTLVGKTPQTVVLVLGRPDHEFGSQRWEWWTYDNQFYDSLTRRRIGKVTLVFHDGKVMDITY